MFFKRTLGVCIIWQLGGRGRVKPTLFLFLLACLLLPIHLNNILTPNYM